MTWCIKLPKVSICIPSYNCDAYIGKAIQSVLDQTCQDFEIIVADDRSTDNSEEVIKSFKDPRIRFFRNEKNIGMVPNTNKASRLAKGEFVGILHPDDYYATKMIEAALEAFSENPNVGFTYSSYVVIDEDDKIVTRVKLCDRDKTFKSKEEFKKLAIQNYAPPSAVLFRRKCYEDVGPFDEEFPYPNDWNMWLRISLKYDSACLSDYLCYYRMHRKSVSTLMYTSFETAMQEYRMLKKFQNKVNPELSLFVEEGARRAAKRALLNSIGGLLTGGRGKALKFFSKALKLEKRNLIWPITPICLFVILSGLNGLRTFVKIYKELPKGLKLLVPFRSPETLFYKYGL
jgi:glycosyltransferase involved in cell wall biosynthesis